MKKIYLSFLFLLLFNFNVINVDAKEIVRTCSYYFEDSLGGNSVSAEVKIYDNNSAKARITWWNYKNVDNSENIQNWDEIDDVANTKCPNYALIKKNPTYAVWLDDNKSYLEQIISKKGYNSSNAHIATGNEYKPSSDEAEKYYKQVVNHTNHIKDVYENYKLENCIDNDKVITRISKCNDIYSSLNTYMNSSENEVNGFIKSNYIDKNDNRTVEFFNTLKSARTKWQDVKKELDEEDKKIKQELGLIDDSSSETGSITEGSDATDIVGGSTQSGGCFICGDAYFPVGLSTLTRNVFNLIKILVPVIIIIMGMIDLLKAVIASDEKKMSEATPKLIRKLISGIMIFLILSIVQFVFKNLLSNNGLFSDSMLDCVNYFIAEEPDSIACPERQDNVTDYINNNKAQACVGKSQSECTGECSWGYHNSSQMHCARKDSNSSGSTSNSGSTTKSCGEYKTSSECPKDRCSWGYNNGSSMHCYNNPCWGLSLQSCSQKNSICKWNGNDCVSKY